MQQFIRLVSLLCRLTDKHIHREWGGYKVMGRELVPQGFESVTSVYHEDRHAEDKRPYINSG